MLKNRYVITNIVTVPGNIGAVTVILLVRSIPRTESRRCDSQRIVDGGPGINFQ
jgi:hypothetical protein